MLASHSDTEYMQRALALATLGRGLVSPNPLVGCVIVEDGQIIGEGWHQKFGEAHAEVNAVRSVIDKSRMKNSTVYVSLEPCAHFGKTPPCADMLVAEQVRKVVVANVDPNPLVAGKGIQKLRDAGINVVTGVLEDEGRHLNRRFFTFLEKKRPYIILKWAQTTDGFIARENFDSKWISDDYSRKLVHKWRGEESAILIGSNTARYDDPQLNVRDWTGLNPTKVVLDRYLKLPDTLKMFRDTERPTLVYNTLSDGQSNGLSKICVDEDSFITNVVNDLYVKKIQSVLVEGGSAVINAFLSAGLWDEARVFVSPTNFGTGIHAPKISINPTQTQKLHADELRLYYHF